MLLNAPPCLFLGIIVDFGAKTQDRKAAKISI
jgi:hypothetical protein